MIGARAAASALLLTAAVLGAWATVPRPAAGPGPWPADAAAAVRSLPGSPRAAIPVAGRPSPRPPTALSRGGIELHGDAIRIAVTAMALREAAQRLASVTHGALYGSEDLLARAGRVTLHWQGRDAAAAWQELLGGSISYAADCRDGACRIWLAGSPGTEPPAVATAPALPPARRPVAALDVAVVVAEGGKPAAGERPRATDPQDAAPGSVLDLLRARGEAVDGAEWADAAPGTLSTVALLRDRGEWPSE